MREAAKKCIVEKAVKLRDQVKDLRTKEFCSANRIRQSYSYDERVIPYQPIVFALRFHIDKVVQLEEILYRHETIIVVGQ